MKTLVLDSHHLVKIRDGLVSVRFRDMCFLVEEEDGQIWLSGVAPGAIAASGDCICSAVEDLRIRLGLYLEDVAEDDDTRYFGEDIKRFCHETSQVDEWLAANGVMPKTEVEISVL